MQATSERQPSTRAPPIAAPPVSSGPDLTTIAVERARVTAELANATAHKCVGRCTAQTLSRVALASRLDALNIAFEEARRRKRADDGLSEAREQQAALRANAMSDPVTSRAALLLGATTDTINLMVGLGLGAMLECIACLGWLIAQLPPCVIGMEACSGAHHWARLFQQYGHTVKLTAPKLVAPYRMSGKRGKSDAADAAAICEAVTRPSMRFVPLKDEHQQATLCLHRTRQGFVEERTAIYNRLRGLLSEFGVVLPQSPERLRREIPPHLDALPGWARRCIGDLLEHAANIEGRLMEYDRAISEIARDDERSRRLMQLRGIGPTTASALLASIGAGHDFSSGRQVAAWVGLTPGQYSSGGKERLGSIAKAGDGYLRSLLVLGARSAIANIGEKQDRFSRWVRSLIERRGYWRAAVAIAAKNARLAWAVLKYGDDFKHQAAAA